MVQISAAETVFRIWSEFDQEGLGQTNKSGSDPKVLDLNGSGSLTLSRTQTGLFKNLFDQKNGRIFFRIAKKSVYNRPKFFEDKYNFLTFLAKNFGRGCWQHCQPDRPKVFAICCKCSQ
jgi:hypothetical protein